MTTTFTPNLGLALQGTGDNSNTWGATLNNSSLTPIDTAMGGAFAVSVAGNTDYTLSSANALNLHHILTGVLTGNINYVFPASAGRFITVYNNTSGGFTVTVKQSGGTGIIIPQGKRALLLLDANTTTGVAILSWLPALALGVPSSATGLIAFYNATNGNITTLQSGIATGNVTFTLPTADGTTGQIIQTDGAGNLSFITISTSNPFSDATAIIKNSSDATKLVKISAASITTGNTRILTAPDFDGTIATLAGTETLTNKTLTAAVLGSSTATTQAILDNSTKVATTAYVDRAAQIIQQIRQEITAVATGTTSLPSDDTVPQSNEGDQYQTVSATFKSATTKAVIENSLFGSHSASTTDLTVALFQDSTAGALAAVSFSVYSGGAMLTIPLRHTMTTGTTSSTAFKIRAGGATGSTTTVNGSAGARKFGGVGSSLLTVTEYAA